MFVENVCECCFDCCLIISKCVYGFGYVIDIVGIFKIVVDFGGGDVEFF